MNINTNGLPGYLFDPMTFADRFDPVNWGLPHVPPGWKDNFQFANGILYNFATSVEGVGFLMAVMLVVMFAYVLRSSGKSNVERRGDMEMRHWTRRQELKKVMSDILTDTVEDARYKDKISKREKYHLYQRFAQVFDLPDLLVAKSPSRKKAEIKQRLGNGVYKDKPAIPGDAPPQIVRKEAQIEKKEDIKKPARKYSMITQSMGVPKTAEA